MDKEYKQHYNGLTDLENGMDGSFRIQTSDGKIYRSKSYGAARKAAETHESTLNSQSNS